MSKSFNRANREQDDRFFSSGERNPRRNKRGENSRRRGNVGDDMSFSYSAMSFADRCDGGEVNDTSSCCDD